jgi:hypothetical protein
MGDTVPNGFEDEDDDDGWAGVGVVWLRLVIHGVWKCHIGSGWCGDFF